MNFQHGWAGGRQVFLGITKRGDKNVRRNLVHGCRSVVTFAQDVRKTDKLSCWIRDKLKSKGMNKTSVAVANKTGRVVWAVLSRQEDYRVMKASDSTYNIKHNNSNNNNNKGSIKR